MTMKLRCKICGREHKATQEHFLLILFSKSKDPNDRNLLGYACSKCIEAHKKIELIKKHNIKAKPGQTITEAIEETIEKKKTFISKKEPEEKKI